MEGRKLEALNALLSTNGKTLAEALESTTIEELVNSVSGGGGSSSGNVMELSLLIKQDQTVQITSYDYKGLTQNDIRSGFKANIHVTIEEGEIEGFDSVAEGYYCAIYRRGDFGFIPIYRLGTISIPINNNDFTLSEPTFTVGTGMITLEVGGDYQPNTVSVSQSASWFSEVYPSNMAMSILGSASTYQSTNFDVVPFFGYDLSYILLINYGESAVSNPGEIGGLANDMGF